MVCPPNRLAAPRQVGTLGEDLRRAASFVVVGLCKGRGLAVVRYNPAPMPPPAQPERESALRAFYGGRRICVTGGAGFIGGHLASELLSLGASVSIIDDLSNNDGQHASYLVDTYPEKARLIFASILEPAALVEAIDRSDIVFHLAAMGSVPQSIEDPERCFHVNALGTMRVAHASREAGVRRLVFASSSAVYGDEPTLPKTESMLPKPLSPYAATKLAGEAVVRAWAHSYDLSGVSLRFFNVFGPRQAANSAYAAVVMAFLKRLVHGQPPVIFGDGSASRDFTPISNVVRACLLAGASTQILEGQAVNIGCGKRTTVAQLATALAGLLDRADLSPIFEPARAGDVPHSVADIALAKSLLGYEPDKSFDEALAETVAWFSRATPARV